MASFLKTPGTERLLVAGSFAPDTQDPISAPKGAGWSAEWTSEGLFTVTFTGSALDSIGQLESAVATLQLATGASKMCQIGVFTAEDGATDATLEIRAWDATTDADALVDVAADDDNRINFICVFRKGSVD